LCIPISPTPSLFQSPRADLDVILQAVNNTNSQNLIQKSINAEINLVNLLKPILKVNLVHLGSASKARAARSNNIIILVVASEDHSASRRNISRTLNSEQRATEIQLLQIESAAIFSDDGVVAAAGQIADDAEDGDVGLALGVQALAFEELLGQAEGVVCELLVGANLLGGSGGVGNCDVVELFSGIRTSFGRLGWIRLTSAMISELCELDCAGRALTPKAAAQEARRNLEAGLENILELVQRGMLLYVLREICVACVVMMRLLISQEMSAVIYCWTIFLVLPPGTAYLIITSIVRRPRQVLVVIGCCGHQSQRGFPL